MSRYWTLLLVVLVSAIYGQTRASQSDRSSNTVLHFKRVVEPRERAFTILAPTDWRATGGILRVNPLEAQGVLNALGAKLDFTLMSADGRTTLHWLPEMTHADLRGGLTAGMFPAGSNYSGALVWPKPDAFSYIDQAMFRKLHPGATNVRVKARKAMPEAVEAYQRMTRAQASIVDFHFDAGLVTVEYTEAGTRWEESLYTVIQDFGQPGMRLWLNKDSFTARSPAGELDRLGPVVTVVLNSFEIDPLWLAGELRGQAQRGEIARRNQQEIFQIQQEIIEHRRRTFAEINNQMHHALMGTEEYVNPITHRTEVGTNAYNYRWVNSSGEAIYTDDANYDPARHGLEGFSRSPARKRFPER